MFDEKFWLAIAFFSFLALLIKFVFPIISKSLENKAKKIADDINDAKLMKEKASKLLIEAEKSYKESLNFAEKIINDAKLESSKISIETAKALEKEINKKIEIALERIKSSEEAVIREIKIKIISSAINELSKNFNLQKRDHWKIIENSIKNFQRIH